MEGQRLPKMIMWRSDPFKLQRSTYVEPNVQYIPHWLPFHYSDQLSNPRQWGYQHGTSKPSKDSTGMRLPRKPLRFFQFLLFLLNNAL